MSEDAEADIDALSALSFTLENGIRAYEHKVDKAESRLQALRNCVSETRDGPIDLDRLQNDGIRRTFIAILNGELD